MMFERIEEAARSLANSRRLVVLTGAGISKESGIPTFREAQAGLWSRYDPQRLATMQGFLANPKLVWEWYQYRLDLIANAQPNTGHFAIAELQHHLPRTVVITQNIDGLHSEAGSRDVVELHGSIHRYKCLRGHASFSLADLSGQDSTPPICPRAGCTSMVRPDVVWFGEALDAGLLQRAYAESETCDMMLIVGTSGVVQPAANLPYQAWRAHARIVEINPTPSELTDLAHIYLPGAAGEILPRILKQMEQ